MKTLLITLLLALLGVSGSVSGEPEKKQAKEKKDPEKQEVVTNETLKKKYGEPAPEAPAKETQKIEIIKKKTAKPSAAGADADRTARIAELNKAEERLVRRIQSLKNPFLPKVPLTDEEKKAEEGKRSDERVQMLEERLVSIQNELEKLKGPARRTP